MPHQQPGYDYKTAHERKGILGNEDAFFASKRDRL